MKLIIWALIFSIHSSTAYADSGIEDLCTSILKRNVAKATRIINSGIDVSASCEDEDGRHPIHEATSHGLTKVVKLLINQGADVNSVDSNGYTPIFSAPESMYGLLVNSGANINAKDYSGDTPIMVAIAMCGFIDNSYLKKVIALKKAGASIDVRDREGRTAVERARFEGCFQAIPYLGGE